MGQRASQTLHLSVFVAPAEHRAEGLERKAGTDPRSPWLPGTVRAGVNWGLRPLSTWSDATSSVSELGVTTPWCRQRGSCHLVAGRVPARTAQEWGQGPGLGQCQWATGDSNFCRRRRRSSAASGSPSSGSSSVPADSGAGDREVQKRNPEKSPAPPHCRLTATT